MDNIAWETIREQARCQQGVGKGKGADDRTSAPDALELARWLAQWEHAVQDRRQSQARVQQEEQPTLREVRPRPGEGGR